MRQQMARFLLVAAFGVPLGGCGSRADLPATEAAGEMPLHRRASIVDLVVTPPSVFDGRTHDADLLVLSASTLAPEIAAALDRNDSVVRSAPLSLFSVPVQGGAVTVASGTPEDLRAFSPRGLATRTAVWRSLARGAAIGDHQSYDTSPLVLDSSGRLPPVKLAAAADLSIPTDVVVNQSWATALAAPVHNALLVDVTNDDSAIRLIDRLQQERGNSVDVIRLAAAEVPRPALLSGGAVAEAVGSFLYRPRPDGTITIDPAWVAQNITSAEIPILGHVTGHRVMLPQLHGAMQELADRGLAHLIDPGQYGGIFVPRFIGRDPSRGLSLHSWGIAIDLNVATNQLGTQGDMDPRVVSVMASWGFAWGGTWSRPDPMHFELAGLRSSAGA